MLSSEHHSFDVYLAAEYGIQEAIMIHHFQHWIGVNMRKKNGKKQNSVMGSGGLTTQLIT